MKFYKLFSIEDAVEILPNKILLNDQNEGSLSLDLTIGQGSIQVSGDLMEYGIKAAILHIKLEGLEIIPGSKFGEKLLEQASVRNIEREQVVHNSNGGKVAASLASTDPSVSVAYEAGSSVTITEKSDVTELTQNVVALPNRWMFSAPNNSTLVGTVLSERTPLCKIQTVEGANRKSLSLSLVVKKKDIEFDLKAFNSTNALRNMFSTNKDRAIRALIAKNIDQVAHHDSGSVVFLAAEFNDD
jgi:hypothetical protein